MIYLLIVEPILLIAYLWYVIHTHAAKSVNIYVKILTLIAWLISFGLVIILPLDMYYVIYYINTHRMKTKRQILILGMQSKLYGQLYIG